MRSILALLAICLMPPGAAIAGETPPESQGVLTAAVVVLDEDPQMRTARECLEFIDASKKNEGDTVLVRVLEATGFTLTKVTAKEFKDDPSRIRFGFEYSSRDMVKTVYWEADCPVKPTPERMASR